MDNDEGPARPETDQPEDDDELDPAALASRIPRFGYGTTPTADVHAIPRRR